MKVFAVINRRSNSDVLLNTLLKNEVNTIFLITELNLEEIRDDSPSCETLVRSIRDKGFNVGVLSPADVGHKILTNEFELNGYAYEHWYKQSWEIFKTKPKDNPPKNSKASVAFKWNEFLYFRANDIAQALTKHEDDQKKQSNKKIISELIVSTEGIQHIVKSYDDLFSLINGLTKAGKKYEIYNEKREDSIIFVGWEKYFSQQAYILKNLLQCFTEENAHDVSILYVDNEDTALKEASDVVSQFNGKAEKTNTVYLKTIKVDSEFNETFCKEQLEEFLSRLPTHQLLKKSEPGLCDQLRYMMEANLKNLDCSKFNYISSQKAAYECIEKINKEIKRLKHEKTRFFIRSPTEKIMALNNLKEEIHAEIAKDKEVLNDKNLSALIDVWAKKPVHPDISKTNEAIIHRHRNYFETLISWLINRTVASKLFIENLVPEVSCG